MANILTFKLSLRVAGLVVLGISSRFAAWAQNSQEKGGPRSARSGVSCAISAGTQPWQLGRPAIISIVLRNDAGAPLDLSVVPILYLQSKPGEQHFGSYWSPVDIAANRPLGTIRKDHGISIKSKPLSLHLDKGHRSPSIDANATNWDSQVSSRWPALPFSKIALPGAYYLSLDLDANSGSIHCNKIEVQITNAKNVQSQRVK